MKTPLFARIPSKVWQQDWVVYCKQVGNGRTALKYLAPYVFRVAVSNRRLVKLENDAELVPTVTFRYRATDTGQPKLWTVPAFSRHHSTDWTLPTMSCFAFPSLLLHWMLDLALAPMFPLVSCQAIFIRIPFSPDLQLVQVGFFVVQSTHIHQFDGRLDLIAGLKSQMVWYVS